MWIIGSIAEILFLFLIDVVGYIVARFVLPLISFGRIRVAPFNCSDGEFNRLGIRRDGFGRIEVGPTAAWVVGLVICLIVLAASLWCVQQFVLRMS